MDPEPSPPVLTLAWCHACGAVGAVINDRCACCNPAAFAAHDALIARLGPRPEGDFACDD